jgi:hypothetical protein
MTKIPAKRKYNSQILCASSLIYLLAGLIVIRTNFYLAVLLFAVTIFSILYHRSFKDFHLKTLDWVFGIILFLYLYYLFNVKFDVYIFAFILMLIAFRLLDHVLFKRRRYGVFSYTHSAWHLLSGIAIIYIFTFT